MAFPSTPRTLLGRLRRDGDPAVWRSSWDEFFDLYHQAVIVCVKSSFAKYGWHSVTDQDLEDVVIRVFESFDRAQETFELDDAKGRLRQFLTTLCQRRVVDFIRAQHNHTEGRISLEQCPELQPDAGSDPHADEEDRAFAKAQIGALLSALRDEVSPRNFMIFELVKLNGEPPEHVARQLGVKRGVIDNSIYKALRRLRDIAARAGMEDNL